MKKSEKFIQKREKEKMDTLPLELTDLICEFVVKEKLGLISHDILYSLNKKRLETYWKKTRVQILMKNGDILGVKYLMEYHKNVKANFRGYRGSYINEVFLCACEENNFEIVRYAISQGNDYRQYDLGLYYAVMNGNLSMVKYLILMGADIIEEDSFVLLESAIFYKHLHVAEYLIFMGAKMEIRINGFPCDKIKLLEADSFKETVDYLITNEWSYETIEKCMQIWGRDYRTGINYLLSLGINLDDFSNENDPLRITKFLYFLEA